MKVKKPLLDKTPSTPPNIDPQTWRKFAFGCPEAIVAFDAQYHILFCNRAAERLFKKAPENLLEDPDFQKEISSIDGSKPSAEFSQTTYNLDGERLDLNAWVTPLKNAQEEKIGHMAFLTDLTEKRSLEQALLEASEHEKKKIGQDLHDDLCQQLVGAAFATKMMEEDLRRKRDIPEKRFDELSKLVNEAVRQARDIVRGLRPVELDAGGLVFALDELLHKTNYKIPVEFFCEKPVAVGNPDSALQAYRIIQETVGDILRMGCASKLTITLRKKKELVTFVIKARGISKKAFIDQTEGMDQKIREYRVRAIDGQYLLESEQPKTLRITCSFPEVK